MQAFVRLEAKLTRRMQHQPYWIAGQAASEAFTTAMTAGAMSSTTAASDFVFVSIDFEGNPEERGVSEFGVAKLDTRSCDPTIESANFRLKDMYKGHKYMHGETTRIKPTQLSETIINELTVKNDPDDKNTPRNRRIVLVGHGLKSDLRIMEALNLHIEELPMVIGLFDTLALASDILGCTPSLEKLLAALRIPTRERLFHCAGNDAHYAMQALLALIQTRHDCTAPDGSCSDGFASLEKLARQPAPVPPGWRLEGRYFGPKPYGHIVVPSPKSESYE